MCKMYYKIYLNVGMTPSMLGQALISVNCHFIAIVAFSLSLPF